MEQTRCLFLRTMVQEYWARPPHSRLVQLRSPSPSAMPTTTAILIWLWPMRMITRYHCFATTEMERLRRKYSCLSGQHRPPLLFQISMVMEQWISLSQIPSHQILRYPCSMVMAQVTRAPTSRPEYHQGAFVWPTWTDDSEQIF